MTANGWHWRTEQVIPSENVAGKRFWTRSSGSLPRTTGDSAIFSASTCALEEALVNAIKHGNGCDISKTVHVVCEMTNRPSVRADRRRGTGLQSRRGFPTAPNADRLEMPCGRGVLLMRSFMSSVEFRDKGNCVVMTKEPPGWRRRVAVRLFFRAPRLPLSVVPFARYRLLRARATSARRRPVAFMLGFVMVARLSQPNASLAGATHRHSTEK